MRRQLFALFLAKFYMQPRPRLTQIYKRVNRAPRTKVRGVGSLKLFDSQKFVRLREWRRSLTLTRL